MVLGPFAETKGPRRPGPKRRKTTTRKGGSTQAFDSRAETRHGYLLKLRFTKILSIDRYQHTLKKKVPPHLIHSSPLSTHQKTTFPFLSLLAYFPTPITGQFVGRTPTSGCPLHFRVPLIACRLCQIAIVWLLQYITEEILAFRFAACWTHKQGCRCYGNQGERECLLDEQSLQVQGWWQCWQSVWRYQE